MYLASCASHVITAGAFDLTYNHLYLHVIAAFSAYRLSGVNAAEEASSVQTGMVPNFPFFQCARAPAAHSLAPTVKSMGGGEYCFKLVLNNCSNRCCKVDL